MAKMNNLMELYPYLDKSNCRKCNEKTCLAFAAAVYQGRKALEECPKLSPEVVARFKDDDAAARPNLVEENREAYVAMLKKEVARLDFEAAAERTGGRIQGDRLVLKIMGRDFSVDRMGNLYAEIHVNPWVAMPFLH